MALNNNKFTAHSINYYFITNIKFAEKLNTDNKPLVEVMDVECLAKATIFFGGELFFFLCIFIHIVDKDRKVLYNVRN